MLINLITIGRPSTAVSYRILSRARASGALAIARGGFYGFQHERRTINEGIYSWDRSVQQLQQERDRDHSV